MAFSTSGKYPSLGYNPNEGKLTEKHFDGDGCIFWSRKIQPFIDRGPAISRTVTIVLFHCITMKALHRAWYIHAKWHRYFRWILLRNFFNYFNTQNKKFGIRIGSINLNQHSSLPLLLFDFHSHMWLVWCMMMWRNWKRQQNAAVACHHTCANILVKRMHEWTSD